MVRAYFESGAKVNKKFANTELLQGKPLPEVVRFIELWHGFDCWSAFQGLVGTGRDPEGSFSPG